MLYRLTIKSNANINGVRLEKGMSVEVASQTSNILGDLKGKELVLNAFWPNMESYNKQSEQYFLVTGRPDSYGVTRELIDFQANHIIDFIKSKLG